MVKQPIKAVVVATKIIAVGVDRLVFHTQVRSFCDTELLLAPRIWADLTFKELNRTSEFAIE